MNKHAYCDDCETDDSDDCDHGCDCCDTPNEHQAWLKKEHAYWRHYFGQDYGTKEEKRSRLQAMDPRPVSAEQMEEWRLLK